MEEVHRRGRSDRRVLRSEREGESFSLLADQGLAIELRTADGFDLLVQKYVLQLVADSSDWHNSELPEDVNANGEVHPQDVLLLIDDINRRGIRPLYARVIQASVPCLDVNGDGSLTPADILRVIDWVNRHSNPGFSAATGGVQDSGAFPNDTEILLAVGLHERLDRSMPAIAEAWRATDLAVLALSAAPVEAVALAPVAAPPPSVEEMAFERPFPASEAADESAGEDLADLTPGLGPAL